MNYEGQKLLDIRVQSAVEALLEPLMPIINEEEITDVNINADGAIWKKYVNGESLKEEFHFDNSQIETVAALLASKLNINASQKSPSISTSWNNPPLRIQILLPPIVDAAIMSIRKQVISSMKLDDLLEFKTITEEQYCIIKSLIKNHKNIIISGETGSGKTTLANAMIREINPRERLIVAEDTRELDVSCCPNSVCLHIDPTVYTARLATIDSMRLTGDRIIIGEVRDGAALDLLKAWNTGHTGGIGTIHANSADSVSLRLQSLIMEVSVNPQPQLIEEAIDAIIHITKTKQGRKVQEIKILHPFEEE